jgi:hypothetical protein
MALFNGDYDVQGKRVPERIKGVFVERAGVYTRLTALRRWYRRFAVKAGDSGNPLYGALPLEAIGQRIKEIEQLVTDAMPAMVCPCLKETCPICNGLGWINGTAARQVLNQKQPSAS